MSSILHRQLLKWRRLVQVGGRKIKSQFWICSVLEMCIRQGSGNVNKIIEYENLDSGGRGWKYMNH